MDDHFDWKAHETAQSNDKTLNNSTLVWKA